MPTRDEVEELSTRVEDLTTTIKQERDARRRANKIVAAAAAVVLLFGFLLWRAIDAINEGRADARVSSCLGMNDLIDQINHIPEDFGRGDFDLVERRVCTPDGIREFYERTTP